MPTPCNCSPTTPCNPCGQKTPCIETNCACPTLLKSECVNNVTVDLPCLNVTKGKTLNEFLLAIDTALCARFSAIQSYFSLKNIGVGIGKLYKGVSILGEKEIKSIKGTTLIDINNLTNEVEIAVNQTALTTFVNTLLPTSNTYSANNVGTGVNVFKDLVANVFNFRKVKTDNSGIAGESILKIESIVGDDILISAKKIDSNSLEITATSDTLNINLPTASEIPSIIINSAYTGLVSTGSMAKPFKNIQDGLDYFVGGLPNTNLNPLRTAFRVVIQKGAGYTFAGNFEYNGLNLVIEEGAQIVSNPLTQNDLINLDTYGDITFDITINRGAGSRVLLQKNGLKNRGTSISTPGVGAYKKIQLLGEGTIDLTTDSTVAPSNRYIIDSNFINDVGYFNRGDVPNFVINGGVSYSPNGAFLKAGGNSKIRFDKSQIVSGLGLGGDVNPNTKFIELVGNSDLEMNDCNINTFFNTATSFNNVITVNNNAKLFMANTRVLGNFLKFINVLSNTTIISIIKTLSTSLGVTEFITSPIAINSVTFDENNILQGLVSINIDLTKANTRSVTNTVQGVKLESLVKRTARTGGVGTADDLPIGGVFINTNNNNVSTATHYRDIKI